MAAPVGSTPRRTTVLSSGPDVAAGPVANSGVGRSFEAGCCDLLQLVVRRLASSGYTEVGEGARHGRFSSKKGVRNLHPVQNPAKLSFEQVARDCAKPIGHRWRNHNKAAKAA